MYGVKRNLIKRHVEETIMTQTELKGQGVISVAGLYRFMVNQTEKGERWFVRFPRLHGHCEAQAQQVHTGVLKYCVTEQPDRDGRVKCSLCKRKPAVQCSSLTLDKLLLSMNGPEYQTAEIQFEEDMRKAHEEVKKDEEKRIAALPDLSIATWWPIVQAEKAAKKEKIETFNISAQPYN